MELLGAATVSAIIGWCLGWLSAYATDVLQRQDELPSAGRGPLVRDPIVQISCALVWALAAMLFNGDWLKTLAAGAIAVPLLQVTVTDMRYRYVYTIVAAVGGALGLALGWVIHGGEWWYGPAGALAGFVAFGVLYALGRLIWRMEALAKGDITIAAMVGAGAGACTLNALVYGILASGLVALGVLIARRSRHSFLPYGPGLCLGGLITLFRC